MAAKKAAKKRTSAKSAGARKSGAARKSAKKSGAKKSGAKKSTAARKSTAAKKSAAKRSAPAKKRAAKKGGAARGRQQSARKQARKAASAASRPAAAAADFSGKNVAEFRRALRANLIRPLELVMLTRDRIEESLEDAVERGRMTRDDAQELATALYSRGRQQTEDLLKDLEQLMGRSRGTEAAGSARKSVDRAADRALKAADPLLAHADRARRAVGMGPSFPIVSYDSLTAEQVQARLDALTPAELRKVRDYERRRGNRKSVIEAIEVKLG